MSKKLFETDDIPLFKAIPGQTFSVMDPNNRNKVTGIGRVVEVKEKHYPNAEVVFELLKGIFIGPTDRYL